MIDEIIVLGAGAIGSVYAAKLAAQHDGDADRAAGARRRDQPRRPARHRPRAGDTSHRAPRPRVDRHRGRDADPADDQGQRTRARPSRRSLASARRHGRFSACRTAWQRGDRQGGRRPDAAWCFARSRSSARFSTSRASSTSPPPAHTLIEPSARSAEIADAADRRRPRRPRLGRHPAEIWRKLIFNCVINPITAIVGSEVGGIADPRLDPLKQLVVDECLRVARGGRRHLRHRLRADDRRGLRQRPRRSPRCGRTC